MELHTKLASLRKQNGLTQLDLAEKLNVSRQAISRWEVGSAFPSTENLKVLSELYGVSVDFLLDDGNDACASNESQKPTAQKETTHGKNLRRYLIFVAALAVTILVIFCILAGREKENDQITPIADMGTIQEDTYPAVTFSIG